MAPLPVVKPWRPHIVSRISPHAVKVVPGGIILVSLHAVEFFVLLATLAIYKKGERSLLVFLASPAGFVFLIAFSGLAISIPVIFLHLRSDGRPRTERLAVVLVLNLGSVFLALSTAEVVIRVFAVNTPASPAFANTLLLPRSWEKAAARNRAVLKRASIAAFRLKRADTKAVERPATNG
jgi:hypothetical protein